MNPFSVCWNLAKCLTPSEDEVIAQIQAGKIKDGDVFSVRSGTRFTGWKSLHARAVCRYHAVNTCRHPLPLSQS
ncbi:hypothetical protein DMH17_15645 [Raoultella planticola]|nr:hypothetical protein [Raoultella planticola]